MHALQSICSHYRRTVAAASAKICQESAAHKQHPVFIASLRHGLAMRYRFTNETAKDLRKNDVGYEVRETPCYTRAKIFAFNLKFVDFIIRIRIARFFS